MWFFMNTCYLLSALSFLMILLAGLQGYFHFFILTANHPTFALLTIIVYLFTQTLIIFYFVGIGISIRDYVKDKKLSSDFHNRSLAVKRKVYPPLLLNILLVMILFITGGAVHTGHLSARIHGLLFILSLIHLMKTIRVQHQCFRESTFIVLDMSGIKHG